MTNLSEYLIIPRSVFYDYDKEKYLRSEELYTFAWLYYHRMYSCGEWISMFSIDGISQRIKFRSRDTRNKSRIKEILITLYDKGYIESNEIIDQNISNHSLLDIFYPKYNSYSKITNQTFEKFENEHDEFFVYACIDRIGDVGRNLSFNSWEKITGFKTDKLIKIFEKMNNEEYHTRIWKFSGDFYENDEGNLRQEVNQYYTRPNEDTIKVWNGFYSKDKNKKEKERFVGFEKDPF